MAKILIATYTMHGAWFSIQLEMEGYDVDIWIIDHYDMCGPVLDGLIKRPFRGKPDFSKYDLVLFDLDGRAHIAEEVLRKGTPCIGDGNLNVELEENRLYGLQVMEECDINVPMYEVFNDLNAARRYIRKTNKRFVFKPDGDQITSTTYVSKDAEDMLRYLDGLATATKGAEFILQEVVVGTEVSTEAWFNGEDFFLINGTLEEKKLMNDNKGPNTGCSGNVVFIYDQLNPPLVFREGLAKMKDFLQEYNYRGMIDLNTIVTDSKIYGLEWTPRFGYDSAATLFSCITDNTLGNFLGAIASGSRPEYSLASNYGAGIRLSIPPYPCEIKGEHPDGIPIEGINEDDIPKNCYLYDCCFDERDSLCTAGVSGFIAVPIQTGLSPDEAWDKVYNVVKKINIPDMMYRTDMKKSTMDRYKVLAMQGWLR